MKKQVKTVKVKGQEISLHKAILDQNSEWNKNVGMFALLKFLQRKNDIELKAILDCIGIVPEKLTIDIIKAIFAPSRLKTAKGKDKTKFSVYSFLKDAEKKTNLSELFSENSIRVNVPEKIELKQAM